MVADSCGLVCGDTIPLAAGMSFDAPSPVAIAWGPVRTVGLPILTHFPGKLQSQRSAQDGRWINWKMLANKSTELKVSISY